MNPGAGRRRRAFRRAPGKEKCTDFAAPFVFLPVPARDQSRPALDRQAVRFRHAGGVDEPSADVSGLTERAMIAEIGPRGRSSQPGRFEEHFSSTVA